MTDLQNQILSPPMKEPAKLLELDEFIYRTIPLHRFYELFNTHQNVLVRPSMWDDPFENLALNSVIDIKGETASFDFKDAIYAQCWTLHTASDAIWRIYSNGTDGVRIRSTPRKVLTALLNAEPNWSAISCFIGKVGYYSEDELVTFSKTHFSILGMTDGKQINQTLLVKRRAFEHEREVRLIFCDNNNPASNKNLYPYQINPHDLIDQVMLHPQLNSEKTDKLKAEITQRTGFKGELKQSGLYKLPKGFVFKINE